MSMVNKLLDEETNECMKLVEKSNFEDKVDKKNKNLHSKGWNLVNFWSSKNLTYFHFQLKLLLSYLSI